MKIALCLAALLLPQYGRAVDDQVGAKIDYGSFEDPAARIRPRFRYWLPDASVDSATVRQNIQDAGALGAGGVEFLPYFNYGEEVSGADWSTYGFGSPAFVKLFKAALQAHKDAGLVMDIPFGPSQGQGVPARPDDEGLQWDLSTDTVEIPGNGSFDGLLPGWGTGDLVAVVSAEVLSSRNLSNPTSDIPIFENIPNYTEYTLKNASLREWTALVSPSGRLQLNVPAASGRGFRLFAFYQHLTLHKNVPSTTNATTTIFDNGSFAVDHFSARGAQTVTRFWEQHILTEDVKELVRAVGNYGWEDSMEITSNISWTPSLPHIFIKKYGYSIMPYLPLIIYKNNNINIQSGAPGSIKCVLDTPDQGSGYVNDFRGALLEGYRNYIEEFRRWTNKMGLQTSVQVSYNMPLDALANVPFVNAPECESLQFEDNVDAYRQFSGPAMLAGKRVVSNEMGAVMFKAFNHPITDLLWQISRAVAGGVNQFVLHGQTYTGNYYDTTWPGTTPFWYLFSDLYSNKQPAWDHGLSEALNYISRLQYTQQKGQPKVDVVLYSKDSATSPTFTTAYNETDLIDEGFSYVYLSPDNFALPQAVVKDGVFAPTGPGFRAMIIPSSSNLTHEAVRDIKKYAQDGLPVILSGGLPHAYYTKEGDTTSLLQQISSLQQTENVYIVSAGKAAKKLRELQITPRVQIDANGTWYTTWRSGFDGVDHLYILGDLVASNGQVNISTTKRPYFFDLWTGRKTPVLHYQQEADRTVIPLSLNANQTAVIGFIDANNGTSPLHAHEVPSTVLGYDSGIHNGSLRLHVSAGQQDTVLKLSDGRTVSQLTTRHPASELILSNWTLTVEHWERPSNLSDATIIAHKRNTTHSLPSLVSWRNIPSIANASGVGYYTTSFSWPQASDGSDGAYIFLPKTNNAARLFVNGHKVPAFDYQSPKVDITPYLIRGINTVCVEVPSVMWNYLRTLLDELRTAGSAPEVSLFGELPAPADNGLIGEVRVVPYVRVLV